MKKIILLSALFCFGTSGAQSLADLYKKINSSVVVIDIVSVAPESTGGGIELVAQASQGSGVLISNNGLIWTAAHVVGTAEEVQVEFLDGDQVRDFFDNDLGYSREERIANVRRIAFTAARLIHQVRQ